MADNETPAQRLGNRLTQALKEHRGIRLTAEEVFDFKCWGVIEMLAELDSINPAALALALALPHAIDPRTEDCRGTRFGRAAGTDDAARP